MSGLVEVNPADIEKELLRVWRTLSERESGEARSPEVRTILSNFILLSTGDGPGVQREIDELVTALCISNPSRFFVIQFKNDGGSELKTFVSSRSVLARVGHQICSEEVHLSVNAETAYLVPNLLFSLFASDVPVVLMVLGDPFGDQTLSPKFRELFSAIRKQTDLILYDTNKAQLFARAALPYLGLSETFRVGDLSWYRTERWRSLVAEQFDSERLLNSLDRVTHIHFSYGPGVGKPPGEAVLIAGWILSALGWVAESRDVVRGSDDIRVICSSNTGPRPRAVEFNGDPKLQCALGSIEFVIEGEQAPLSLKITRHPAQKYAEITSEHGERDESSTLCDFSVLRVPFRTLPDEDLIVQPFYSTGKDDAFIRSSNAAAKLSQVIG